MQQATVEEINTETEQFGMGLRVVDGHLALDMVTDEGSKDGGAGVVVLIVWTNCLTAHLVILVGSQIVQVEEGNACSLNNLAIPFAVGIL